MLNAGVLALIFLGMLLMFNLYMLYRTRDLGMHPGRVLLAIYGIGGPVAFLLFAIVMKIFPISMAS